MPVHIFLRRSLPPHLSSHGARFPLRTSQVRFFSFDYLRSLRSRRIPWTITREDLRKPEAELIEVVRNGIWEDPNGASRQMVDKRARHDAQQETKRRKIENGEEVKAPVYATEFSKEDIESEQRRPKKKVAVLLGYSGTGYKGMQLSETEKTIEGELFAAFVAAGAISKANATDPKKSSLVRCARTDKGVHAAGNIVSLKLIVEDDDIIQKINEKLSPQIRVWDILVTNKSFSSYQLCDSRIYEYLIPTYCFLPPHPSTYLGKKLVEYAEKEGDLEAYKARQEEVAGYWDEIDDQYIRPILENTPEDVRKLVEKVLHLNDEDQSAQDELFEKQEKPVDEETTATEQQSSEEKPTAEADEAEEARRRQIFETVKAIKAAYLRAKKAYRIPATRLARVQETLDKYVGTNNFFNYTIQKVHADPSSKRHIKSFNAAEPILINGTEWLSLKVHGQSFMMHQIRKMVAMAAMVVRCGCDPQRIVETYGANKIAIPKAPGLGLLLERPVFNSYNRKTLETGKDPINFDKHADTINEFKQREIYDRIFREEEESNAFSAFFGHLDHYSQEEFLYVTSGGIPAAKQATVPTTGPERKSQREALAEIEGGSDDESAAPNGGEEGG
ncbi:tRNA pseudouridine synthase [Aspergillus sclerotioniger CBS 115572]|uniref:tRNA pseudouridine synthase 1 n=1 Tax=Aspergillus sclerotioniger CBS 115572 TaxID=1450535 RepID=A0A317X3X6_9EURO|nr:tRNA pseudouridine synthase [Aspergillus sclerotioniger CBS 115572]PWY93273.1 tRNA pseudouridine synthase [Aspergillus sclerotioniger CBS 115572]